MKSFKYIDYFIAGLSVVVISSIIISSSLKNNPQQDNYNNITSNNSSKQLNLIEKNTSNFKVISDISEIPNKQNIDNDNANKDIINKGNYPITNIINNNIFIEKLFKDSFTNNFSSNQILNNSNSKIDISININNNQSKSPILNDNSTKSESEKPTINSVTVTATATPVETEEPPTLETATPTPEPTIAPTPIPVTTPEPTVKPTVKPTKKPVVTPQPTAAPTPVPVTPTATPVTPAPVVDTPVTEQPVVQPATPSTDATIQSITDSIVTQVNELRASLGLSALRADSTLTSIAQYRSQHMGDNNYFSHYYNGEKHFKVVADMYGYTGYGIGENIAWMEGYPDSQVADTAMVGWINSPGHYNNMVNTMWTSIGVGAYKIGNKWYLTQIFGTT